MKIKKTLPIIKFSGLIIGIVNALVSNYNNAMTEW